MIVPVLSRIIVSTSPQASTALPDMAMTLKRVTRSIPAIPMAESRPPMVVGSGRPAGQSEWRRGSEHQSTPQRDTGHHHDRKMMVRDTRSVFRAIHWGFSFLEAPQPERSCGPEAVAWVGGDAIFSQSETTVVPPVTEQKSPPDLPDNGADSPVMADYPQRRYPHRPRRRWE